MGWFRKFVANDVILLELYVSWFSGVSNDEMSEAETLDTDSATTGSGDCLWHYPVIVSDSESCRTDEEEKLSFRTSIHSGEELEGICGIKLNRKWVMRCFLTPQDWKCFDRLDNITEMNNAVIGDELMQLATRTCTIGIGG
jgi:hypothetical protein